MAGSFRRLVRNLRKMHEALIEREPSTITVHDDCLECGSRVSFQFKDIALRQTAFTRCWKCDELLRMVKTPEGEQPGFDALLR